MEAGWLGIVRLPSGPPPSERMFRISDPDRFLTWFLAQARSSGPIWASGRAGPLSDPPFNSSHGPLHTQLPLGPCWPSFRGPFPHFGPRSFGVSGTSHGNVRLRPRRPPFLGHGGATGGGEALHQWIAERCCKVIAVPLPTFGRMWAKFGRGRRKFGQSSASIRSIPGHMLATLGRGNPAFHQLPGEGDPTLVGVGPKLAPKLTDFERIPVAFGPESG